MDTAQTCAELDLRLFRVHHGAPQAELRFHDGEANQAVPRDPVFAETEIETANIPPRLQDLEGHGRALASQLFEDANLRREYCLARRVAEQSGRDLRLLLTIDPSAAELQELAWEALWDPHADQPWWKCSALRLSRLITRQSWRPMRLRRRSRLQVVAARALPSDLERYGFDVATHRQADEDAWQALSRLPLRLQEDPLTIDCLSNLLRGGCDVLYLAGVVVRGRSRHPHLMLSNADGKTVRLSARDLGQRLREVLSPPRLIVLAPPISAPRVETSGLSSLAPWLIESGVASVVVLEEGLAAEHRRQRMPQLLEQLLEDGEIERPLAALRGHLESDAEASGVRLFVGLRAARLWYEPSFAEGSKKDVKWAALETAAQSHHLTPIIGWGLGERVYGSSQDLALRMAGDHFPLAPYQKGDLPSVSQFVQIAQRSSSFALKMVKEQMAQEILARHRHQLGASLKNASLPRLLRESGRLLRQRDDDPYKHLAELPCPIYINATADTLMKDALIAAGKSPEVAFPKWRKGQMSWKYEREPTVDRPLIYHIFGYFGDQDSLVLTEDDHLDFLIRSGNENLPAVVRQALAGSSLLFLGFRTTDWSFRVLYRMIMDLAGSVRRDQYSHAVAQVDPEGDQLLDLAAARRYLARYYDISNISLFWGSGEDFLAEFNQRLRTKTEPKVIEEVS